MAKVLRLSRYTCVAGLCAVLHNAIMIGFDQAGVHYMAALGVSFVTTLLVAYRLHCQWTFGSSMSLHGVVCYGAAMIVNLPVSAILITTLHVWLALPMVFAAPLATLTQLALNYTITARSLQWRPDRRPGAPN